MLNAAGEIVSEYGYGRMSVALIVTRAGVSRETFYDHFENCEDCFLAAFDEAVTHMTAVMAPAYEGEGRWSERLRGALAALLRFLEYEPTIGSLVFVDALGGGSRVLEHRARVLEKLRRVIEEGQSQARPGRVPPRLTAEGVVGGVLGVIHARLIQGRRARLIALAGPLMSMIVLPYLGPAAAAKEFERPAPRLAGVPKRSTAQTHPANGLLASLKLLPPTYRTLRVLRMIAEQPGACNRELANAAGIADKGQVSKLLARLENLELIHSSGKKQVGDRHEWRLTARGEEVERAIRVAPKRSGR
jgi:AcrR family transcriptional regulator/DNA-binding MarR family transcriptional regulator